MPEEQILMPFPVCFQPTHFPLSFLFLLRLMIRAKKEVSNIDQDRGFNLICLEVEILLDTLLMCYLVLGLLFCY